MTTDSQIVRDRPEPRDRVLGALFAAACGDAIGAPFEGSPAPAIGDVVAWESATTPLRWTDDTALLITTAEQFAGIGGSADDEAIVRAYAAECQPIPVAAMVRAQHGFSRTYWPGGTGEPPRPGCSRARGRTATARRWGWSSPIGSGRPQPDS